MALWLVLVGLLAAGTPVRPRALVGGTLVDGTGAPPVPRRDRRRARREDRVRRKGLQGAGRSDRHGRLRRLDHARPHGRARPLLADGLGRRTARRVRRRGIAIPTRDVARIWRSARSVSSARSCARASRPSSTTEAIPGPSTWPTGARDDPRAPRVAAAGPLLSTLDFWLNLPGGTAVHPPEGSRMPGAPASATSRPREPTPSRSGSSSRRSGASKTSTPAVVAAARGGRAATGFR